MKRTRSTVALARTVDLFAENQGSVLSIADLENLLCLPSKLSTARAINRLVREEVLYRVQRGIYITSSCDLWVLASRISPNCYVSMDSALAYHGLIGTVPKRRVFAVHAARRRIIATPQGDVSFFSTDPSLLFGFTRRSDGVAVADPEKAFIDLLAYHNRGVRYVIDPLMEVRVDKLNRRKVNRYLKHYQNPRFIAFVKGQINAKS